MLGVFPGLVTQYDSARKGATKWPTGIRIADAQHTCEFKVDFKAVDFCSVEVQKCNLHEYGVSEKHIETHSSCLLKMSSLVSTYPIVGMPDEMIHTH